MRTSITCARTLTIALTSVITAEWHKVNVSMVLASGKSPPDSRLTNPIIETGKPLELLQISGQGGLYLWQRKRTAAPRMYVDTRVFFTQGLLWAIPYVLELTIRL